MTYMFESETCLHCKFGDPEAEHDQRDPSCELNRVSAPVRAPAPKHGKGVPRAVRSANATKTREKHRDNVPQARINAKAARLKSNASTYAGEFREEDAAAIEAAGRLLAPAREAAREKVGE